MIAVVIFIGLLASLLFAALCGFEDLDWSELETGDEHEESRDTETDPRDRGIDMDMQGKD